MNGQTETRLFGRAKKDDSSRQRKEQRRGTRRMRGKDSIKVAAVVAALCHYDEGREGKEKEKEGAPRRTAGRRWWGRCRRWQIEALKQADIEWW